MSIKTGTILSGATIAASGGTSVPLLSRGGNLGQVKVILDDGSQFLSQTEIDCSIKGPKVNTGSPSGYTQHRNIVKLSRPMTLSNGSRTINSITLNLGTDIELTDVDQRELRLLAAQVLTESSFEEFWIHQSVE